MRTLFVLCCAAVLGLAAICEAQRMGQCGRARQGTTSIGAGRGMGVMPFGGRGRWATAGRSAPVGAQRQCQLQPQGVCRWGSQGRGQGLGRGNRPGCRFLSAGPARPADFDEASVSKALRVALLQEYTNGAYYREVLNKFGSLRRFDNLRAAEGRHAEAVLALHARYGIEPPGADEAEVPEVPSTLAEAIQVAIRLEEKDVAMYDELLGSDLPEDVKAVFRQLRTVSVDNHLEALRGGVGGGPPQGRQGFRRGRAS